MHPVPSSGMQVETETSVVHLDFYQERRKFSNTDIRKEGNLIILIMHRNQLTAKGIHKHEGYNFCDRCHEQLYDPRVQNEIPSSSYFSKLLNANL